MVGLTGPVFLRNDGYYHIPNDSLSIDWYTILAMPKPMIPKVQRPNPHLVQRSLWKVGIGLSEGVIYIALMINK